MIPDYRVLMGVAYAPLFVVGAPFGWPPGSFFDVITWPMVNQFVCIAGGFCGPLRLDRIRCQLDDPGAAAPTVIPADAGV